MVVASGGDSVSVFDEIRLLTFNMNISTFLMEMI